MTMERTTGTTIDDESDNKGDADDNGDNNDDHNGNDNEAMTTRPRQQDHDNETTTRYNSQLNGGPSAVDCDDDDDNDGNSNGNGSGDGKGDGDGEGDGGSTRCNDNNNDNNNNPLPVIVDVIVIQRLCLCRAVTTTAALDGKVVAVVGKGGMATATAPAATTTSTMRTTIPCPLLLMSSSSGVSVFAALDQRRRWGGNGVVVVNKAGRTAVDRDERDGATLCNGDKNHPYPIVPDGVIIWCLCLCGNGMATAAAGRQQGGEDRGSGCHSPAMVGRGG